MNYSPPTYTFGFSHDRMKDSLIHCVHYKRDLEFLLVFDSLPSHLVRMLHFSILFFFLLDFWHLMRKGARGDKERQSFGKLEGEHNGFAKQHEECLLVKVTSRWTVVIRCWIFHGILCQLIACKLEFTALNCEELFLLVLENNSFIQKTKLK